MKRFETKKRSKRSMLIWVALAICFIAVLILFYLHYRVKTRLGPPQAVHESNTTTYHNICLFSTTGDSMTSNMPETPGEKNRSLFYFENFKKLTQSVNSKLYHDNSDEFQNAFHNYIQTNRPIATHYISKLNKYSSNLEIELNSIKEGSKHNKSIYYKVLITYFQMLRVACMPFEMTEIGNLFDDITTEEINLDVLKFIYQQSYLYQLTYSILNTVDKLGEVIRKEISKRMDEISIVELSCMIFGSIYNLKANMFAEFNDNVNFRVNEKLVTLKYLLSSLESLRSFVVLNIYVVYLHIFEVDEEYNVINVKREFIEIVERFLFEKKANFSADKYKTDLEKNCKGIFAEIPKIKEEITNEFFEGYKRISIKCNRLLVKIAFT